jgi:hypothetical protein
MTAYLQNRPRSSHLLRIVLASAGYVPVYLFFGLLVSPFVIPYYADPAHGLGLQIPPFSVMIPPEILRGFLYVASLLPLQVALKADRKEAFLLLSGIFFLAGAGTQFLAAGTSQGSFPVFLRIIQGLEILGDSLVYGWILA